MASDKELEELKDKLEELEARINALQDYLEGDDSVFMALAITVLGISVPRRLIGLIGMIKKVYTDLKSLGMMDDISRVIIGVLAAKGEMCVSELEREVRRVRGSASRRIIYDRLRLFEGYGVLRTRREGNRRLVSLEEKYFK